MRQRWLIAWICLVYGASILAQSNDNLAQIVHVVEPGDTLTAIAVNYGVTVDEITATNDLDPNAILRIGQRIVIEFAAAADDPNAPPPAAPGDATAPATETAAPVDEARAIGGIALDNALPPAPVAAADAPMMDPAALNPVICASVYADDNQNGAMDPGETTVSDGRIRLLDSDGNQLAELRSDAGSQPHCIEDAQPRIYIVAAAAPEGYGLTGSGALRVDLRAGQPIHLAFGAKAGFDIPGPPPGALPPTEIPASDDNKGENLLRELSGLFVLALAGFVLVCGSLVSLFLRFR